MTTQITDPWLLTVTGRQFNLLNPTPADVRLDDIGHALGKLVRFAGHVRKRWTVAEHSVLVALILRRAGFDAHVQMCGLFHDAAEAYIGDIPTPVKWAVEAIDPKGMDSFRALEWRIEEAIEEKFHLNPAPHADAIKLADRVALATEARDLLPADIQWPGELPGAVEFHVECVEAFARLSLNIDIDTVDDMDFTPHYLFVEVYKALAEERIG